MQSPKIFIFSKFGSVNVTIFKRKWFISKCSQAPPPPWRTQNFQGGSIIRNSEKGGGVHPICWRGVCVPQPLRSCCHIVPIQWRIQDQNLGGGQLTYVFLPLSRVRPRRGYRWAGLASWSPPPLPNLFLSFPHCNPGLINPNLTQIEGEIQVLAPQILILDPPWMETTVAFYPAEIQPPTLGKRTTNAW